MKICKNSDSGILPEWAAGIGPDSDAKQAAAVKPQMGEADMVAAKEQIERCAKESKPFHIHADLDQAKKSELAEYAEAVGLDRKAITEVTESKRATCEALGKLSQPEPKAAAAPAAKPVVDFDLTPKVATDEKNFKKDGKWNRQVSAQRMQERPAMAGIVPIRGGEKYDENPVVGVRPGENSIGAPDAIAKIAEEKDHGEIIREQNDRRRAETVFSKDSWEAEKLAAMDGRAVAAGATPGLRRTDSVEAQRHSASPAWAQSIKPDPAKAEMPEKTAGEKLADAAEQRRKGIQRDKPQDDWNKVKPLVRAAIGDELVDALKKHLAEQKAK